MAGLSLRITGLRETIRAFRDLPKDADRELRDANQDISDDLATEIAEAAAGSSAQSALMARTVKARRGRTPSVAAGGAARVGRHNAPAFKILFGANFGATYLKQFRPHRGAGDDDYWFYSTAEKAQPRVDARWGEAADRIVSEWGRDG